MKSARLFRVYALVNGIKITLRTFENEESAEECADKVSELLDLYPHVESFEIEA